MEATLCQLEQMCYYSAIDKFNTLCYTGGRLELEVEL